jgi:hypothetical protein
MNRAGLFLHPTSVARSHRRWRVVRQDDNGNVFVVAEVESEAEAHELAETYEACAHKEMYFVEPVDE